LYASQASSIRLFSDRFGDQDRYYEGPSFGDKENHSVLKLVHDGDYRIARRVPLRSFSTESRLLTRDGSGVGTDEVFRIRLVTLRSVDGHLDWQSAPVPEGGRTALSFFAYSGRGGNAELVVSTAGAIPFPLGSEEDFDADNGSYRLCHRAAAPRSEMAYGGYVLVGRFDPGTPVPLSIRFRAGPTEAPMFVSVDRGASTEALRELAETCGVSRETTIVNGADAILDSNHNSYPENVGPWQVADVF
jgi:hypothetical protein